MYNLNLDIFELITNLLPMRDIIAWAQTTKISAVLCTSIYRDHLLLLQKDNFDTHMPNCIVLEFHINYKISNQSLIYHCGLCSKFKLYTLLKKIIPSVPYWVTAEAIEAIIINSNDEEIIPIINLVGKRQGAAYITKYCQSYKILNVLVNNIYINQISNNIVYVSEYYNHVLLKIILEKVTPVDKKWIIKRTIEKINNTFWSKDMFRMLIEEEIRNDTNFLRMYAKKMFLYGCKYKSLVYFQENNLIIDDTFPMYNGIRKCCGNVLGFDIVKWILDRVNIGETEILELSKSVIRNKDICKLWINFYDKSLIISLKKLTNWDFLSNQYINAFYNFLEAKVIIYYLTNKKKSCQYILEGILPDVLNYLCINVDFTKISKSRSSLLLLCFWSIKDKRMLNKFITSDIVDTDKNKILIKFLYLVTKRTNINDIALINISQVVNDIIW